jgi:hypothetical protein
VFRPLFLGLLVVPAGLQAADFTAPAGCETFLTVQETGCEVGIYYRCSADPVGHQWRIDFGINGRTYETLIDREARWLKAYSPMTGVAKVIQPGEPDPASFSGLVATGYDSMEFTQLDTDGVTHHYKGYDRLTGETVVIDGQTLKRTEFEVTEWDGEGNFVRRVKGNEYISEEFGRFFGGQSMIEDWTGESYPSDSTPIDFILPGEPGFGSTVPLYQCNEMMSGLFTNDGGTDDQG